MSVTTTRPLEPASATESAPLLPLEAQRRFTVEEFHRMLEAEVFSDEERLELLDGVVVEMTRQGRPHARVIQRLDRRLQRQLGDEYAVLVQLPVTLSNRDELIPDLAVVRAADAESNTEHPQTALLVIEVADTTIRKDRLLKAVLYAKAQIVEYWIVNVTEQTVEVYREPDAAAGRYRTLVTLGRDQTVTSAAVPGVSVPIGELFA